jgi:hypothetical protein
MRDVVEADAAAEERTITSAAEALIDAIRAETGA